MQMHKNLWQKFVRKALCQVVGKEEAAPASDFSDGGV